MPERRYTEDEVAAIFERASQAQKSALSPSRPGEGLTLAELQAVGDEVGIPKDLVAQAARSLDAGGTSGDRHLLGLPIGVSRTVELERPLTEAEWQRVVVDLRETFDARGRLSDDGPFKQWTNGNLEALLEPTEGGQRLRLRTLKGSARSMMTTGLAMAGVTAAIFVARLVGGGLDPEAWRSLAIVASVGVGMFGVGALQLPTWARLRRRQMGEVAERTTRMIDAESAPTRNPDSV